MKMTNKEDTDGSEPACDTRLAAFLAVHVVRQILDDAYVIVNSTTEPGPTWRYQSLKNVKPCETDEEDLSSKAGSDIVNENKIEHVANVVATSTPQKVTAEHLKCRSETSFIGQGDEELDMRQNELAKSTSMIINHLFDMSEVETVIVTENTEHPTENEPNEVLAQAMAKIMDSYVNTAMAIVFEQSSQSPEDDVVAEKSSGTEHSEYSFLSDAFVADIDRDIAFYINDADDAGENNNYDSEVSHVIPTVQITEINEVKDDEGTIEKNDVARFENAYLSLNRDYEQCSEDDANVILDDPKGMTLQEVELMTANTSEENLSTYDEAESHPKTDQAKELKELQATSAVSASSKKSLVSRCRTQGARLLACLRGWWRRRTPGRRKLNACECSKLTGEQEHQHRVQGSVRGLCPLSPDARRRAASLVDQRLLRSPSPSRAVVWKFNTVNEALVNSSRWKEYTFDVKPDECGEY